MFVKMNVERVYGGPWLQVFGGGFNGIVEAM